MKNLFLVLFLNLIICSIFTDDTIINDTGNWKGKIWAEEKGFLYYGEAEWEQTGANIGSESIWSFFDDYEPVITKEGSNKVKCTYKEVGWIFWSGGPTVSDEISFKTSKEVISTATTATERKQVDKKRISGFINNSEFGFFYEVTFSGSSTETWAESNSLTNSIEVSDTDKVSGSVKVDSLVELGGETSVGVKVAVTNTRTTTNSGSHTSSLTLKVSTNIPPAKRVDIYVITEALNEKIEVKHHVDKNTDGISEGEATDSFEAVGDCSTVIIAE